MQVGQVIKQLSKANPSHRSLGVADDVVISSIETNLSAHKFYATLGNALIVLSLFESSYPQSLAVMFLQELRRAFMDELKREHGAMSLQNHYTVIETASRPYQYIKFERIIQKKWSEFKDPRSNDCLKRLNRNLVDISNIMNKNINDLILRGENLEDVGRRADELKEKSKLFATMARKASLSVWFQTYLPFIIFGFIALSIIFFLVFPIF